VAVPAEQLNEPQPGTYEYLLYKSEESLAPFHKNSTAQEMEALLQELHKQETARGNIASEAIKTLLKNRKLRLRKMIACIDVENSPRDLKKQFMSNLCDDFGNHINNIIHCLPDPVYVGDLETLKDNLASALFAFRSALDALETIEYEEKTGVRKISTRKAFYKALLEAATCCDKGLSNWDTTLLDQDDANDVVKKEGLAGYVVDTGRKLQEQVAIIENIYYPLLSIGSKLLQERELEDFEGQLRQPILKTLLNIAAQKMPDDKDSRECIITSAIHTYICDKDEIIRSLRLAKFALNLSLNRYRLIKPPGRVQRKDLDQDRIDCYTSLKAALQKLKEKQ